MAPNFRTLRHGIDIGWDLGRNFYRGADDKAFGLIRALDRISDIAMYQMTEIGGVTGRHLPPDGDINDWLYNGYPPPFIELRYLSPTGHIVVIDQLAIPAPAFPETPPVPPEEMDPIFTLTPEEGKWLYTESPWELVGKVLYYKQAEVGHTVWSKVDACWVVWTGAAWVPFLRADRRAIEISGARFRPFYGGFLMVYVAVDEFVIPRDMPGSTGYANIQGAASMQVQRNGVQFGSVSFPPNGRMTASSSEDVVFSPGDRLSIYADGATGNMKEVSATIKGLYL